jgi:polysaccharide deacetylase family protein (PEP-CTERM system associated)
MVTLNALTIDVEDWYHILDSPTVPVLKEWERLESRVEHNVIQLLDVLARTKTRATFFWLGWLAERHQQLVKRCFQTGHEIASHGFAHLIPNQVGPIAFRNDLSRAKKILEDLTGQPVLGFRAPGFGITKESTWVFDILKEEGFLYDASVFPASHGHGGIGTSPLGPYTIKTQKGPLVEFPMSALEIFGHRVSFFGGGYLRLSPVWLIRWGIKQLQKAGQPLIVYVHPREIDPCHPRLPLSFKRKFKCYINLKSTIHKITWLCNNFKFAPMVELTKALSVDVLSL